MSPEMPIQKPVRKGDQCNARVYTAPSGVVIESTLGCDPVCIRLKKGVDPQTGEMKFRGCHNPGGVPEDCPAEERREKIVPFSSPKTPSQKQAA